MKQNQESTSNQKATTSLSLTKALAAATVPQRQLEGGPQVSKHEGAPEIDPDQVMQTVGEKKKAFEMTCRFFAYQVATSSISNIIGTVMGHPLDTIRVSSCDIRALCTFSSTFRF